MTTQIQEVFQIEDAPEIPDLIFRRFRGDPVLAAAAGRVVVVDRYDVRGDVIIVDHGYGIFFVFAPPLGQICHGW